MTLRPLSGSTPARAASTSVGSGPLKVLFVTNMYPQDENPASGAFVCEQAEHLRKAGHQVDVLHIKGSSSRLNYLKSPIEVFARTRSRSYDVVHAHYGLSGFPALFRYRTPVVITLHGSDALIGCVQPCISKAVCSFADAVIVVSKRIFAKIPGEVIPCGVDLAVFRPRDRTVARARLGLPAHGRVVLFPFDPRRKVKRHELARAAVTLCGPDTQMLTIHGVPNTEMPWYYSAADVMVLCSESEGSPTSVKEALACNIPVVSTDVGDVREIMDGIEGCEVCNDDAGSLASGLMRVLGRQIDKSFEGRAWMSRYDQSRVIAAIVKVYERVIHNRPSECPRQTHPCLSDDRYTKQD